MSARKKSDDISLEEKMKTLENIGKDLEGRFQEEEWGGQISFISLKMATQLNYFWNNIQAAIVNR